MAVLSRNIRTDVADTNLVQTLSDADVVFALPSISGRLEAITVARLKTILGCPTAGLGDPNTFLDGPPGRLYSDLTVGSERIWTKTTALGVLTGWQ